MKIYHTSTMRDAHIDTRTHKARKAHQCCSCKGMIEKGDHYTKTVGTIEGYFVSNAWHDECHKNHVGYVEDQRRKE
jgi:hypothetical protein